MTKQQQEWARVCEESQLAPAVCGPAEAAEAIRKVIEKTNGYEFEHIVALFLNNQSKIIGTAVIGIVGLWDRTQHQLFFSRSSLLLKERVLLLSDTTIQQEI